MKTKTKQARKGSRPQPSTRRKEDRSLNSDEQNKITNTSDEDEDYEKPVYSSDQNEVDGNEGRGKRRTQKEEEDEES